ncbi:MAG: hypothetical protein ACQGVC_07315, partial [Myxococcota bacterium]
MSEGRNEMTTHEELLHAYHDGELSGFARWRFERELRRNPVLRGELDRLSTLRDLLRARDRAEPSPDLWDAIALRLPAEDARRGEAHEGHLETGGGLAGFG